MPRFEKFSVSTSVSQLIKYPFYRVLRFWPTFAAVSVFCYVLKDYQADRFDKPLLDSVFFFPIKKSVPIAFAGIFFLIPLNMPYCLVNTCYRLDLHIASWSNRVDLECGIVLICALSVLSLFGGCNMIGSIIAMFASVVPKILRFLNKPELSYLQVSREQIPLNQKYIPVFIDEVNLDIRMYCFLRLLNIH